MTNEELAVVYLSIAYLVVLFFAVVVLVYNPPASDKDDAPWHWPMT